MRIMAQRLPCPWSKLRARVDWPGRGTSAVASSIQEPDVFLRPDIISLPGNKADPSSTTDSKFAIYAIETRNKQCGQKKSPPDCLPLLPVQACRLQAHHHVLCVIEWAIYGTAEHICNSSRLDRQCREPTCGRRGNQPTAVRYFAIALMLERVVCLICRGDLLTTCKLPTTTHMG